jgi:hypothetical protein
MLRINPTSRPSSTDVLTQFSHNFEITRSLPSTDVQVHQDFERRDGLETDGTSETSATHLSAYIQGRVSANS